MIKRWTASVVFLALSARTAFADWHHHHGGGSDLSADPHFDAFMLTNLLVMAASLVLLLFGGPGLIIWGRRIRDTLWLVPSANLLLYVLSISLRPYPGGFAARFQSPGLPYTIAE